MKVQPYCFISTVKLISYQTFFDHTTQFQIRFLSIFYKCILCAFVRRIWSEIQFGTLSYGRNKILAETSKVRSEKGHRIRYGHFTTDNKNILTSKVAIQMKPALKAAKNTMQNKYFHFSSFSNHISFQP